ncbi:unnamed protein product [Fusarium graminearum]|uniref:Chromosome 4, complete genome n=1 Tax=Gibberella zeae (strain ATCC MYA-4620 / CBS 123657 / FGSC 9075 / NRRL 31084 / PH-1) TaxID=229533 RepID=I1S7Y4_GIBZE|nr:hypothetical protein FGSG_12959 [Fusarium graminearum PH-1]ESU12781.1 hypothetical protein FGSG_12959 [Fusarium graminearum PH-1]CEF84175.1 unnamed protein product [Fusarium graminearum]CZS72344.1 unnamed protein product [Fusarium graminearum]|eukprot:XP_011326288.1 hypothetical protein FGSG_12959 [Fusarium graminearum PH-1]
MVFATINVLLDVPPDPTSKPCRPHERLKRKLLFQFSLKAFVSRQLDYPVLGIVWYWPVETAEHLVDGCVSKICVTLSGLRVERNGGKVYTKNRRSPTQIIPLFVSRQGSVLKGDREIV